MASILDEFENLHADDEIAFVELAIKYKTDFDDFLRNADNNYDTTFDHIEYMNKVVAAASALEIEPFGSWDIPPRNKIFNEFDSFSLALQRFVTGVQIRKGRAAKIYSVELDQNTKTQIHFFIGRIRDVVEGAGLESQKKNSLYKKLNAFATDVDMSRTGLGNAMLMGMDIAHLAKEFGEAIKPATDFVRSINELLGGAKAKEPEALQLPAPKQQKRIPTPPKRIEGPKADEYSRDLDDDIPF